MSATRTTASRSFRQHLVGALRCWPNPVWEE
jgi:hypothetical protein